MPEWCYAKGNAPVNAAQALEISVALTELQKHVESGRTVGQPTSIYLSVTGEEYVVLAPTVLPEGEASPIFPTLDEALAAARAGFDAYAKDRPGAVYWRVKPEVRELQPCCHFAGGRWGWGIYMRLLVSDKPAKEV